MNPHQWSWFNPNTLSFVPLKCFLPKQITLREKINNDREIGGRRWWERRKIKSKKEKTFQQQEGLPTMSVDLKNVNTAANIGRHMFWKCSFLTSMTDRIRDFKILETLTCYKNIYYLIFQPCHKPHILSPGCYRLDVKVIPLENESQESTQRRHQNFGCNDCRPTSDGMLE